MFTKPTIFKKIGKHFTRQGATLVAVKRPDGLPPNQACKGCFFDAVCIHRLQCSSFDRKDKTSVWFKRID